MNWITKKECGCEIKVGYDLLNATITYCPKHKSAPDLYEALKKAHTLITSIIPNDLVSETAKHTMQKLIVKTLAKVDGK